MPRGSSVSELKKKRKKLFARPDSAIGRTKNTNQGKTEEKKSSGKKLTTAQKMAKANIKKYGGTASAAKANKAAMKLKIKKAYMAKKKKK